MHTESNDGALSSAPTAVHNPSYIGPRHDIVDLVPLTSRCILDIGCSTGALGRRLKERQQCEIHGIDINPSMLDEAGRHLDHVYMADLNLDSSLLNTLPNHFDTVIAADILEHLVNPWSIVDLCHSLLLKGGSIIISIPNVSHVSTIKALLSQKWPYRDRGIHDRTHLRFFSKRNIDSLVKPGQFKTVEIRRNLRIIERPSRINQLSFMSDIPYIREYFTFQYLVRAIAE